MLISQFLADFPDLDRDIGTDLADISRRAMELDRKGKVTVEIAVERKGGRVMVQVNHTSKPPKPDPEAGLYYLDPNKAALTKDDPWQTSIDDIDPATGEITTKEK